MSCDQKFRFYPKGGSGFALTVNEDDKNVVLRDYDRNDCCQAWKKVKVRTGVFVYVNEGSKAKFTIQLAGRNLPLRLISYEGQNDEQTKWSEKKLNENPFMAIEPPAGKNPNQLCWTVYDVNGYDGAVVGTDKFQAIAEQKWVIEQI